MRADYDLSLSKREANQRAGLIVFEDWKQSGLTQKTFCKQQQLGLGSFQRWRRIFMQGEARGIIRGELSAGEGKGSPGVEPCLGDR